jgi:Transglutaminase-like superfamily
MRRLGVTLGPRRRKATEAEAIDFLLLQGWSPAVVTERRAEVEPEAQSVLERFVGLGLGFDRTADGARLFDLSELANFTQWSHTELGDPFWGEQTLYLARRVFWLEHGLEPPGDVRPPRPSKLPPRQFCVSLRRRFDLSDRAVGSRVRLRLPLPIEDATLSVLDLAVDPAPDAEIRIAPARLDAKVVVPANGVVELGYEVSFVARPTRQDATAPALGTAEAALYTRPNEGLIKVTAEIQALARELAAGAHDPWTRVERFWRFVMERLRFGVINYEELDAARPLAWALNNGWCDCYLGAALLTTFCRADGIPSRILSGYALDEDTPYFHYWMEAWIDGRGWTPLDTISWSLSRGGRDPQWADYLFGEVNYRMITERLPHLFNGAGAIRFPPAVIRIGRIRDGGLDQGYYNADTRALIYADHVAVRASHLL